MGKEEARKFVSLSTYNQLNTALYKAEHAKTPKDVAKMKEKLKTIVGKLFTYKEIFEFHDDHIIEIAETIVGLYPEREDLNGYTFYILEYLKNQIAKYERLKMKYTKELAMKEKMRETDFGGYLDVKYRAWTYTDGYYCQQAHMYRLLKTCLTDLVSFAERGVICRAKKHAGQ